MHYRFSSDRLLNGYFNFQSMDVYFLRLQKTYRILKNTRFISLDVYTGQKAELIKYNRRINFFFQR